MAWSFSYWSQRYAERIWGEFFFGPANFRKIAGAFLSEILMANFERDFFGLVFPGFQATVC